MAKAVVPIGRFKEKFGNLENTEVSKKLKELIDSFLKN